MISLKKINPGMHVTLSAKFKIKTINCPAVGHSPLLCLEMVHYNERVGIRNSNMRS